MNAAKISHEKDQIIRTVRQFFEATLAREKIGMNRFEGQKRFSEKKADGLITKYPKLKYVKFIFTGFFGLHKYVKLALLLPLLAVVLMLFTGSTSGAILTLLNYLFWVAAGLAIYGGMISLYSGTLSFLSSNNEVETYKSNVVDVYNRFVELYTENWQDFDFYWIAQINKTNCEFRFQLNDENRTWDPAHIQEYLQTKFNRKISMKSITPNEISFSVVFVEKKIASKKQAEDNIRRLDEKRANHEWSLIEEQADPAFDLDELYEVQGVTAAAADALSDSDGLSESDYISDDPNGETVDLLDYEQLGEVEKKLEAIVGLQSVKDKMAQIKTNRLIQQERVDAGQMSEFHSQHMLFTGNPGTGKTMMARLVAEMLHALDVVPMGHLVEVTRKDLVGEYIGHTAVKTQEVIDQAWGGILFIDEAYSLARGGETDFGLEAIDVLVKAMDENKDSLVVILAGYTDEMEDFLNKNSGLRSRISTTVEFADYTADELLEIALRKFASNRIELDDNSKAKLYDLIQSQSIVGRNDDGNGRLIDKIVQEVMSNQAVRLSAATLNNERIKGDIYQILPADIMGGVEQEAFDLDTELSKIIGNEEVKRYIKDLEAQVKVNKQRKELNLPAASAPSLHMVFKGNPGTGKTTFARIIADLYRSMGLLKKGNLVEVDRSDLVGAYIGHTEQQTKKMIEKALGGILFIDEAYSLARGSENDFGKEAIDVLLKAMEDYRDNLVVIVAGYENEMETFLNSNPGLRSRFSNTITFHDYTVEEMYQILVKIAEGAGFRLNNGCRPVLEEIFAEELRSGHSGNGRFARTLFEKATLNMSNRLAAYDKLTEEELLTFLPVDFTRGTAVKA
ncbi:MULTISPECIES: AAA family ATPase [unclassified Sporosarcina]|uniref:AAA family ATPase n=1 Tax=unclassified Sporosarcina TaxID=2647733 RepID=UPI00203DF1C7|nr:MULTISPECIES: AAA family ATPase [unclassified Sporosarcina]GKV66170.1 hypothetical protein NCCP2331_23230 [Sporosarcina sp. NCCP-2331]GLB56222.1 hypothetical protein NCCP2378_20090 [Sporosarcina sp. NCCP-2378]